MKSFHQIYNYWNLTKDKQQNANRLLQIQGFIYKYETAFRKACRNLGKKQITSSKINMNHEMLILFYFVRVSKAIFNHSYCRPGKHLLLQS